MQNVVTAGMEGKVRAMSKLKTLVVIVLLVLLCSLNFYLEMYLAKEELERQLPAETWIYDENDKSTWWYEQHTIGAGRDGQNLKP